MGFEQISEDVEVSKGAASLLEEDEVPGSRVTEFLLSSCFLQGVQGRAGDLRPCGPL